MPSACGSFTSALFSMRARIVSASLLCAASARFDGAAALAAAATNHTAVTMQATHRAEIMSTLFACLKSKAAGKAHRAFRCYRQTNRAALQPYQAVSGADSPVALHPYS